MARLHDDINDKVRAFIERQHMFFVASAPLNAEGHINLSPKGLDTFRILDNKTVAYVDYYGSGAETIAHMRENQRAVICFCAFEGAPNILRLHGKGRAIERCDDEWESLSKHFNIERGVRAIIVVDVTRIMDSCGYAVPLYEYKEQRKQLGKSTAALDDETLLGKVNKTSLESIDGLPALRDPEGLLKSS